MLRPVVEQCPGQRHSRYLQQIALATEQALAHWAGCSNLAHALAVQLDEVGLVMKQGGVVHLAIIFSYNDLLSVPAPLREYPEWLRRVSA